MKYQRFSDPDLLQLKELSETLDTITYPTIQFSKSNSYNPKTLDTLNLLCKHMGSKLDVRFFGHYGEIFDASVLKYLPDVESLLVDCLDNINNIDGIYGLTKLKKISFGVLNHEGHEFFEKLSSTELTSIRLGQTKKNQIDLRSLQRFKNLKEVGLSAQTKGITYLDKIPSLETLILSSIKNNTKLDFISRLPKLKRLEIILGGRKNINEVESSTLEHLKIVRVRGFDNLGTFSRFPQLESLCIEDQIRLKSISFSKSTVRDFSLYNCKKLEHLNGLKHLNKLTSFRVGGTALNLDKLENHEWPKSLRTLALYSNHSKNDDLRQNRLKAKGFKEFS